MPQALTRREFLRSCVPAWFTARFVRTAVTAVVVGFVALLVVSLVRSAGIGSSLVLAGCVALALLVLVGSGWLLARVLERVARWPIVIRATLSVLVRTGLFIAAAIPIGLVYQRWRDGGDVSGAVVSLVVFLLFQVQSEVARLREEKSPDGAPDKSR